MKQRLSRRTVVPLMLTLVASIASAAQAQPSGDRKDGAAAAAVGSPAAAGAGDAQQRQASALRDVRMSELIGKDFRDARGNDVGSVEDLVIDSTDNRVRYAVVSLDQASGPTGRLLAFPLNAFGVASGSGLRSGSAAEPTRSPGSTTSAGAGGEQVVSWNTTNELVLNVDTQRLEAAPAFERDRWPDFAESDYPTLVERYWGDWSSGDTRATAGGSADAASAGTRANPGQAAKGQVLSARTLQQAWRATELLNAKVTGAQSQQIGEIEDAVVDARTGEIRYVVVAFDHPDWLRPDKLAQVPGHQVIPKSHDRVVVNFTKDQLAQAPAFDRNRWPDLNDPRYRKGVDEYLRGWREDRGGSPGAGSRGTGTSR